MHTLSPPPHTYQPTDNQRSLSTTRIPPPPPPSPPPLTPPYSYCTPILHTHTAHSYCILILHSYCTLILHTHTALILHTPTVPTNHNTTRYSSPTLFAMAGHLWRWTCLRPHYLTLVATPRLECHSCAAGTCRDGMPLVRRSLVGPLASRVCLSPSEPARRKQG
jgi:hypothetical protein